VDMRRGFEMELLTLLQFYIAKRTGNLKKYKPWFISTGKKRE